MATVGFSDGPDILCVAQTEDFLVFFETIRSVHAQGFRKSTFARKLGKGQLPLMAGKLWRGWVPYDEMEQLEAELRLAKEVLSKMPLSAARWEDTLETEMNMSGKNLDEAFSRIFIGLTQSISGSREYHRLGDPKYPVRTIVAEIPACSTMLRLPEAEYFRPEEPPLWTFYSESREHVIVLDGGDS